LVLRVYQRNKTSEKDRFSFEIISKVGNDYKLRFLAPLINKKSALFSNNLSPKV